MEEARFADAVRDYGASYELSKDPALLYKLGRAFERAGKCEVAVTYYQRYLREGQPAEPFVQTTSERIAACGGAADGSAGSANGSAATGSAATGSAAPPPTPPAPPAPPAPSVDPDAGAGSGSALALPRLSNQRKAAWIVSGGALALVTLGGVLAYAASSSENDVRDLYAGGFGNVPPSFDRATRQQYEDLIDQGRRYQHLSWAAFGAAGAAAVGAALLFWLDDAPETPRIAPVVSPTSAGVSVRF